MQRTNIYLTETQMEVLHAYARRTGLKFSEVVRRIVDDWVQRLPQEASPGKQEE